MYVVFCIKMRKIRWPSGRQKALSAFVKSLFCLTSEIVKMKVFWTEVHLTLSKPIFLPPAYSPALIYFGRERGLWIPCNYPTVLKEKNRNTKRKSTTCPICWLKSILHEETRREQEIYNVGLRRNIPSAVCLAPPEDKQVMLETCRGP
jgi:hypothetical protein